jgi:spore germination cell wall hydrolase CwlJ-like protein
MLIVIILILVSVTVAPTDLLNIDSSEVRSLYIERKFVPPVTKVSAKQAHCLTQAIYYEAGNQPQAGKEAVALVIINRALSPKHPKTICGVVRERHTVRQETDDLIITKTVCQFSFWCGHLRTPVADIWKDSERIAKRVLQNYWDRDIIFTLDRAMYFHADYVSPSWKYQKVFLGKVGNHLFYADRPQLT